MNIKINGYEVVVGSLWIVRSGQIVRIAEFTSSGLYPVVHDMGKGSYQACRSDGTSCLNRDEWDLIAPTDLLHCECSRCKP